MTKITWWYSIVCLLFKISPEEYSARDFGPDLEIRKKLNVLTYKPDGEYHRKNFVHCVLFKVPEQRIGLCLTDDRNSDDGWWHVNMKLGSYEQTNCRWEASVGF